MATVIVSSAGTSGPRGNGWLSGVGNPANSLGFDGDYYINTAVPGLYYGPKANGVWPASASFTGGSASFTETGLISGAVMTPATATTFNVSAGAGIIVDYTTNPAAPTFTAVTIPAQTVTLTGPALTRIVSWWTVNAAGVISSLPAQPTADQRRTSIRLGVTAFTAGALTDVQSSPVYVPQHTNQLYDLMLALGPFRISGAAVTPNGANLRMNLSAGQLFSAGYNYAVDANNPHVISTIPETPAGFYYATQLVNSEAAATLLDPTRYDVGGVLTAVGGGTGTTTIQRVYLFDTMTAGTQLAVQYGQNTYGSLSAAVAAVGTGGFVQNPDFTDGALIAWVCMTRVCASLADTTNCTIVTAGKFATP